MRSVKHNRVITQLTLAMMNFAKIMVILIWLAPSGHGIFGRSTFTDVYVKRRSNTGTFISAGHVNVSASASFHHGRHLTLTLATVQRVVLIKLQVFASTLAPGFGQTVNLHTNIESTYCWMICLCGGKQFDMNAK